VAKRAGKISSVVCPYCDGENTLPSVQGNGDHPISPNREIACKWCCSLFLVSEGKLHNHPIPRQAPDVA
jgi:uncharacterized Zn-finger protein